VRVFITDNKGKGDNLTFTTQQKVGSDVEGMREQLQNGRHSRV